MLTPLPALRILPATLSAAVLLLHSASAETEPSAAPSPAPAPAAQPSPAAAAPQPCGKAPSPDKPESGPAVPLFPQNGAPAGWTARHWADIGEPAHGTPAWTVQDGTLTGSGDRGSWLISDRDYGDFTLEYEFRLGPRGNSGLAFRAPAQGDPAFDGLELQMADLRYNPDAKDSELTGGLYRALPPRQQVYKPEQWNRMQVTLSGSRLTARLNDVLIHDVDLSRETTIVRRHDDRSAPPLKDRPLRGRIGFQNLSRDGGKVEIRHARVQEPGSQ